MLFTDLSSHLSFVSVQLSTDSGHDMADTFNTLANIFYRLAFLPF